MYGTAVGPANVRGQRTPARWQTADTSDAGRHPVPSLSRADRREWARANLVRRWETDMAGGAAGRLVHCDGQRVSQGCGGDSRGDADWNA